jgi:uncharacterized protein (DUF2345 family)
VGRQFRFRVREGHQIHASGEGRTTTHGAGYEFVLPEQEAAELLRTPHARRSFELVEVLDDDESDSQGQRPAQR